MLQLTNIYIYILNIKHLFICCIDGGSDDIEAWYRQNGKRAKEMLLKLLLKTES